MTKCDQIIVRLTPTEKAFIKAKAKDANTTISHLVLNFFFPPTPLVPSPVTTIPPQDTSTIVTPPPNDPLPTPVPLTQIPIVTPNPRCLRLRACTCGRSCLSS